MFSLFIATCFVLPANAEYEPSPSEPELFDVNLAQSALDRIDAEIADLEAQRQQAIAANDQMGIERDFIALNEHARADLLQQARSDARAMAISAYIGIGPPISGILLLDAEGTSELAFRHSLLRQQSERMIIASQTYARLSAEADERVVSISDEMDAHRKRIETLNREIRSAKIRREEALWMLSIAEIHAEADAEFATNNRVEPEREQWRKLRFCESTETYAVDTNNGFFGAYQFTEETWETVGGTGNPALAPAAEQDARARLLYSRRGSQPWPICGRFLP